MHYLLITIIHNVRSMLLRSTTYSGAVFCCATQHQWGLGVERWLGDLRRCLIYSICPVSHEHIQIYSCCHEHNSYGGQFEKESFIADMLLDGADLLT